MDYVSHLNFINAMERKGFHLQSDKGYVCNGKIGQVEMEEEFRADMIDLNCNERHKKEKRNFKGYDEDSW